MTLETNKPSIIYMGTPEFAVAPLQALSHAGYTIKAVVTVADKPAGRGRSLKESPVKQAANELGLKILQPTNLKSQDFIDELTQINADLYIVVAFRMLPEVVWSLPKMGTFNLHGSLLPKYRGAAPINWVIINGESETGLTTFMLDEEIDTGKILDRATFKIPSEYTAGDLHDALMPIGAELVVRTVEKLQSGDCVPMEQLHDEATHAPKLNKENTRLNFELEPKRLVQMIKGLSPFPGAYFGDFKFLNAEDCDLIKVSHTPILWHNNGQLYISYPLGTIKITEIKAAGKRNMSARDFANGMKSLEIAL